MPVLSFVSASVSADRRDEVIRPYTDVVAGHLGAGVRQTFLLVGEDDTLAIATVWNSREDLDSYIASVDEPLARRLLREAGGEPQVRFFDIQVEAQSGSR
jgi:transcription elongation GreA/GreB family factor